MSVNDWNKAHPVGAAVRCWKGSREGEGIVSTTRTEAFEASCGTPCVFVKGVPGFIALTHVEAMAGE